MLPLSPRRCADSYALSVIGMLRLVSARARLASLAASVHG